MSEKCINIDGSLVMVSEDFDAAEGSEDMKAMSSILVAARQALADRPTTDCHSPRCDYDEPHDHGFACGPRCLCGHGMQAVS